VLATMGHEEKYLLIGNVVARHRKPIARCSMSVPIPPPATAPICPPKEGEKDRHRLSGPLSGRGCAPPYDRTRQPILPAIIVAAQPAIVVVATQSDQPRTHNRECGIQPAYQSLITDVSPAPPPPVRGYKPAACSSGMIPHAWSVDSGHQSGAPTPPCRPEAQRRVSAP